MRSSKLYEEIERAFGKGGRSDDTALRLQFEYPGELDHYRARSWQDVVDENRDLNSMGDLGFLSPTGFIFFLPAFMVMVLEDPSKNLVYEIIDRMCELVADGEPLASLLPGEKKSVVRRFLELIRAEEFAGPVDEKLEMLIESLR